MVKNGDREFALFAGLGCLAFIVVTALALWPR